ncbi:MAG TPA: tRNA lysidine(34) synthetase TilS [Candidatus Kapabacteria bacterium]
MENDANFILHPSAFTLHKLEAFGVRNDSRLLVAVSGGPDSLALADVLHKLQQEGAFAELAMAHVNHRLRGEESDEEDEVVDSYARQWDIDCFFSGHDTKKIAEENKMGIEETARFLRYEFFEDMMEREKFDFLLTAHTANDQAETVLLNIMRGTGVRGLAGIPQKRKLWEGFVLRPWLDVTKEEVLHYATENNIAYRHDSSNDELIFRRNQVRHKVLPLLQQIWPEHDPALMLMALAGRMRDLSEFLERTAIETIRNLALDGGLSFQSIVAVDPFLFHGVLEAWIHSEFGYYGLMSEESSRVAAWLGSNSPRMELRRGISLRKDGKVLRLESDGRY